MRETIIYNNLCKNLGNIPTDDQSEALKKIALDIDYSNFKGSVARGQGQGRAHTYHDVWASLWRISEKE